MNLYALYDALADVHRDDPAMLWICLAILGVCVAYLGRVAFETVRR